MLHDKQSRTVLGLGLGIAAFSAAMALIRAASRFDFRGRCIVITGGSRGLGLLLARESLRRGAGRVVLLAREAAELEKARVDLTVGQEPGEPERVAAIACDVRRVDEIERAVEEVVRLAGRIDVLINNAGIIQVGPCEEMTVDDFADAMAVHFWGPLHAMLAVVPQMLKQGGGRIVNIASIGGKVAIPHLAPYCASKFALVGLSDALRAELAGRGIRITTVSPGLMRTGSHVNALFKGANRKEYAWFAASAGAPLISMDARRAAQKVLDACADGSPALDLGMPARMLMVSDALAPSLVGRAMALASRLLPGPLGEDRGARTGWESASRWAPSMLTRRADREIPRNNELRGHAAEEIKR